MLSSGSVKELPPERRKRNCDVGRAQSAVKGLDWASTDSSIQRERRSEKEGRIPRKLLNLANGRRRR